MNEYILWALQILAFPLIGAAIGWFTNYLAIKMLFHPRKPVNLLVTRYQGVFPKRKPMLAERLGRIVARDLFSTDKIKEKLDSDESRTQIKDAVVTQLEDYIVNKFKPSNPMIGMVLTDKVVAQIKEKLGEQLDTSMPKFTGQIADRIDEVDIESMVRDKVAAFSDQKLEDLLMSVIKKELKFVEVAGAVLGFVIGCIQMTMHLLLQ